MTFRIVVGCDKRTDGRSPELGEGVMGFTCNGATLLYQPQNLRTPNSYPSLLLFAFGKKHLMEHIWHVGLRI